MSVHHQKPSDPKYQIYLTYISDLSYSYDYQVDQFCKIARNYRHQVKSAKKYLMLSRVKEKAQFPSCPILDCVYLYIRTLLSGILFLGQRLLYHYFVTWNECQLMLKSLNAKDVFCFYNFLLELINL